MTWASIRRSIAAATPRFGSQPSSSWVFVVSTVNDSTIVSPLRGFSTSSTAESRSWACAIFWTSSAIAWTLGSSSLAAGDTGVTTYPIASDEDPSVHAIAEEVQEIARAYDLDPAVELVENPRSGETMVESFTVDTARTHEELGWHPERDVAAAIERRIDARVTTRDRKSVV